MKNNNSINNNYIIFWLSQAVSQLGSSMTGFALVLWAYQQTGSALTISLLTFASYLPYIIVSMFAGSFVDKHKKKYILLISDLISFLSSFTICILFFLGGLEIWHIYVANFICGIMNSFQSPASQVAVGLMIPQDKIEKVSGMNSFTSSLVGIVTPTLAAAVLSVFGLSGVLLLDGITFMLAFIILLFFIHIPEPRIDRMCKNKGDKKDSVFRGSKDGLRFLLHNKGLLYIICSMAVVNFFSRLTYENILSPMILARSNGDSIALGVINGIMGVAGLIGASLVSIIKLPKNKVKLIYTSLVVSFLFGDLLMGFGRNAYVWGIAGAIACFPIPFINAGVNAILYSRIPKEMQGRVFAVRNSLQYAMIPFGLLLGGILADYVFEPWMASESMPVQLLRRFVGTGKGSGMAVMFIITGILGALTGILWYRNKYIRSLHK